MKQLLLILGSLLSLAASCRTDEPELAPIDRLPPATRSGEYTFGCLVNGEAFVPENTSSITAIYQGGFLQMGGGGRIDPGEQDMQLYIYSDIRVGASYNLADSLLNDVRYVSRGVGLPTCRYERDSTLSGTLTITHFDDEEYIVSGTFEFTTATEGCDTIRVTDGRFDIPYIP